LSLTLYFFLNPAGHLGLTAVTFLIVFPLTQEIVDFFTTGVGVGVAVGVGVGVGVGRTLGISSLTLICGVENVKPATLK